MSPAEMQEFALRFRRVFRGASSLAKRAAALKASRAAAAANRMRAFEPSKHPRYTRGNAPPGVKPGTFIPTAVLARGGGATGPSQRAVAAATPQTPGGVPGAQPPIATGQLAGFEGPPALGARQKAALQQALDRFKNRHVADFPDQEAADKYIDDRDELARIRKTIAAHEDGSKPVSSKRLAQLKSQQQALERLDTEEGWKHIQRHARQGAGEERGREVYTPADTGEPERVPAEIAHLDDLFEEDSSQLKDGVFLSRTVGRKAFGIPDDADNLDEVDAWVGKLASDKGFGAWKMADFPDAGELARHGKGDGPQIFVSMATPAGARGVFSGGEDPLVYTPRDSGFRITRVDTVPEGDTRFPAGSKIVYAVAQPSGIGEAPRALGKALSPAEKAATRTAPREKPAPKVAKLAEAPPATRVGGKKPRTIAQMVKDGSISKAEGDQLRQADAAAKATRETTAAKQAAARSDAAAKAAETKAKRKVVSAGRKAKAEKATEQREAAKAKVLAARAEREKPKALSPAAVQDARVTRKGPDGKLETGHVDSIDKDGLMTVTWREQPGPGGQKQHTEPNVDARSPGLTFRRPRRISAEPVRRRTPEGGEEESRSLRGTDAERAALLEARRTGAGGFITEGGDTGVPAKEKPQPTPEALARDVKGGYGLVQVGEGQRVKRYGRVVKKFDPTKAQADATVEDGKPRFDLLVRWDGTGRAVRVGNDEWRDLAKHRIEGPDERLDRISALMEEMEADPRDRILRDIRGIAGFERGMDEAKLAQLRARVAAGTASSRERLAEKLGIDPKLVTNENLERIERVIDTDYPARKRAQAKVRRATTAKARKAAGRTVSKSGKIASAPQEAILGDLRALRKETGSTDSWLPEGDLGGAGKRPTLKKLVDDGFLVMQERDVSPSGRKLVRKARFYREAEHGTEEFVAPEKVARPKVTRAAAKKVTSPAEVEAPPAKKVAKVAAKKAAAPVKKATAPAKKVTKAAAPVKVAPTKAAARKSIDDLSAATITLRARQAQLPADKAGLQARADELGVELPEGQRVTLDALRRGILKRLAEQPSATGRGRRRAARAVEETAAHEEFLRQLRPGTEVADELSEADTVELPKVKLPEAKPIKAAFRQAAPEDIKGIRERIADSRASLLARSSRAQAVELVNDWQNGRRNSAQTIERLEAIQDRHGERNEELSNAIEDAIRHIGDMERRGLQPVGTPSGRRRLGRTWDGRSTALDRVQKGLLKEKARYVEAAIRGWRGGLLSDQEAAENLDRWSEYINRDRFEGGPRISEKRRVKLQRLIAAALTELDSLAKRGVDPMQDHGRGTSRARRAAQPLPGRRPSAPRAGLTEERIAQLVRELGPGRESVARAGTAPGRQQAIKAATVEPLSITDIDGIPGQQAAMSSGRMARRLSSVHGIHASGKPAWAQVARAHGLPVSRRDTVAQIQREVLKRVEQQLANGQRGMPHATGRAVARKAQISPAARAGKATARAATAAKVAKATPPAEKITPDLTDAGKRETLARYIDTRVLRGGAPEGMDLTRFQRARDALRRGEITRWSQVQNLFRVREGDSEPQREFLRRVSWRGMSDDQIRPAKVTRAIAEAAPQAPPAKKAVRRAVKAAPEAAPETAPVKRLRAPRLAGKELTTRDKRFIKSYLKDKKSIQQIATEEGVSYGLVHKTLSRNNVQLRSRGAVKKAAPVKKVAKAAPSKVAVKKAAPVKKAAKAAPAKAAPVKVAKTTAAPVKAVKRAPVKKATRPRATAAERRAGDQLLEQLPTGQLTREASDDLARQAGLPTDRGTLAKEGARLTRTYDLGHDRRNLSAVETWEALIRERSGELNSRDTKVTKPARVARSVEPSSTGTSTRAAEAVAEGPLSQSRKTGMLPQPIRDTASKTEYYLRLPDGSVLTHTAAGRRRSGGGRPITHVLVTQVDNHQIADYAEKQAKRWEEAQRAYKRAVETNDWSEFTPAPDYRAYRGYRHPSDRTLYKADPSLSFHRLDDQHLARMRQEALRDPATSGYRAKAREAAQKGPEEFKAWYVQHHDHSITYDYAGELRKDAAKDRARPQYSYYTNWSVNGAEGAANLRGSGRYAEGDERNKAYSYQVVPVGADMAPHLAPVPVKKVAPSPLSGKAPDELAATYGPGGPKHIDFEAIAREHNVPPIFKDRVKAIQEALNRGRTVQQARHDVSQSHDWDEIIKREIGPRPDPGRRYDSPEYLEWREKYNALAEPLHKAEHQLGGTKRPLGRVAKKAAPSAEAAPEVAPVKRVRKVAAKAVPEAVPAKKTVAKKAVAKAAPAKVVAPAKAAPVKKAAVAKKTVAKAAPAKKVAKVAPVKAAAPVKVAPVKKVAPRVTPKAAYAEEYRLGTEVPQQAGHRRLYRELLGEGEEFQPNLADTAEWTTHSRGTRPKGYPRRQRVTRTEARWTTSLLGRRRYAPEDYTSARVLRDGHADPDAPGRIDWDERPSAEGPLRIDADGRPSNPVGRTGLRGRGDLPFWGPNPATHAVVTRDNPETGKRQVLVVKGQDGKWHLPGGLTTEAEDLRRDRGSRRRAMLKAQTGVDTDTSRTIYRGYADDPLSTDNAWVESDIGFKHLTGKAAAAELRDGARWMDVDAVDTNDSGFKTKLYGAQGRFVGLADEQFTPKRRLAKKVARAATVEPSSTGVAKKAAAKAPARAPAKRAVSRASEIDGLRVRLEDEAALRRLRRSAAKVRQDRKDILGDANDATLNAMLKQGRDAETDELIREVLAERKAAKKAAGPAAKKAVAKVAKAAPAKKVAKAAPAKKVVAKAAPAKKAVAKAAPAKKVVAKAAPATKVARPGRRAEGVLDPISVYADQGEEGLRARLAELTPDQLKDIIAQQGMNQDGLALRWRTPEKLINRIVERSSSRSTHGEAFLPPETAKRILSRPSPRARREAAEAVAEVAPAKKAVKRAAKAAPEAAPKVAPAKKAAAPAKKVARAVPAKKAAPAKAAPIARQAEAPGSPQSIFSPAESRGMYENQDAESSVETRSRILAALRGAGSAEAADELFQSQHFKSYLHSETLKRLARQAGFPDLASEDGQTIRKQLAKRLYEPALPHATGVSRGRVQRSADDIAYGALVDQLNNQAVEEALKPGGGDKARIAALRQRIEDLYQNHLGEKLRRAGVENFNYRLNEWAGPRTTQESAQRAYRLMAAVPNDRIPNMRGNNGQELRDDEGLIDAYRRVVRNEPLAGIKRALRDKAEHHRELAERLGVDPEDVRNPEARAALEALRARHTNDGPEYHATVAKAYEDAHKALGGERTTRGQLKPAELEAGHKVLITQSARQWNPATSRDGATEATVREVSEVHAPRTGKLVGYKVTAELPNGRRVEITSGTRGAHLLPSSKLLTPEQASEADLKGTIADLKRRFPEATAGVKGARRGPYLEAIKEWQAGERPETAPEAPAPRKVARATAPKKVVAKATPAKKAVKAAALAKKTVAKVAKAAPAKKAAKAVPAKRARKEVAPAAQVQGMQPDTFEMMAEDWRNPPDARPTRASLANGTVVASVGSWSGYAHVLKEDTGDRGVAVYRLETPDGQELNGTAWRHDGVVYIAQHGTSTQSRKEALEWHRRMRQFHGQLGNLKPANGAYVYRTGASPHDKAMAKRYGSDDFKSAMSTANGGVVVWNSGDGYRYPNDPEGRSNETRINEDLLHETGHNVTLAAGMVDGVTDQPHRDVRKAYEAADPWQHVDSYRPSNLSSHIQRQLGGTLDRWDEPGFRSEHEAPGLTEHGHTTWGEALAEDFALWRMGQIGVGRLRGQDTESRLYFRDLFPERAALFDHIDPEFANRQMREIAHLRGNVRPGAVTAAPLTGARGARVVQPAATGTMIRRPAMHPGTLIQRTKDGAITGQLGGKFARDLPRVLDEDTGPDGVPIKELWFSDNEYRIQNGTAFRHDGITYAIEHADTPEGKTEAKAWVARLQQHRKELEAQGVIPGSDTYAVLLHDSPRDKVLQARTGNPDSHAAASAWEPSKVMIWRNGRELGATDEARHYALTHEDAHHAATRHGFMVMMSHDPAKPETAQWVPTAATSQMFRQVNPYDNVDSFIALPGSTAGRRVADALDDWDTPRQIKAKVPGAATRYGRSDFNEALAEDLAAYQAGAIGTGRLKGSKKQERLYFRDLFPRRAAAYDRAYPEVAARQKAEIAAARGTVPARAVRRAPVVQPSSTGVAAQLEEATTRPRVIRARKPLPQEPVAKADLDRFRGMGQIKQDIVRARAQEIHAAGGVTSAGAWKQALDERGLSGRQLRVGDRVVWQSAAGPSHGVVKSHRVKNANGTGYRTQRYIDWEGGHQEPVNADSIFEGVRKDTSPVAPAPARAIAQGDIVRFKGNATGDMEVLEISDDGKLALVRGNYQGRPVERRVGVGSLDRIRGVGEPVAAEEVAATKASQAAERQRRNANLAAVEAPLAEGDTVRFKGKKAAWEVDSVDPDKGTAVISYTRLPKAGRPGATHERTVKLDQIELVRRGNKSQDLVDRFDRARGEGAPTSAALARAEKEAGVADRAARKALKPAVGRKTTGALTVDSDGEISAPKEAFNNDSALSLDIGRRVSHEGLTVSPDTKVAMQKTAGNFRRLSKEQKRRIFSDIMLGRDPAAAIHLLHETGIMDQFMPELRRMQDVSEGDSTHKNIYDHTLQVLRNAINQEGGKPDLLLRMAALLHDVAKPKTKGEDQHGHATFHAHDTEGAPIARRIMKQLGFSDEDSDTVKRLVQHHLRTYGYGGDKQWTDRTVGRFTREMGPDLDRLIKLSRADVTTKNAKTRRQREARLNDLVQRIEAVGSRAAAREAETAITPDLNGNEVKQVLGIAPEVHGDPRVRDALAHLRELRRGNPDAPVDKAKATRALKAWAKKQGIEVPGEVAPAKRIVKKAAPAVAEAAPELPERMTVAQAQRQFKTAEEWADAARLGRISRGVALKNIDDRFVRHLADTIAINPSSPHTQEREAEVARLRGIMADLEKLPARRVARKVTPSVPAAPAKAAKRAVRKAAQEAAPEPGPRRTEAALRKMSRDELVDLLPEESRAAIGSDVGKGDLVMYLAADRGVRPGSVTETPGIAALRKAVEGGDREHIEWVNFRGDSAVTKLTKADGSGAIVRKRIRAPKAGSGVVKAKDIADADTLASRVGRRAGLRIPAVYRASDDTIYEDYIPGKTAGEYTPKQIAAAISTPEGRALHLFDLAAGLPDRDNENLIIHRGQPRGIDYGMAFWFPTQHGAPAGYEHDAGNQVTEAFQDVYGATERFLDEDNVSGRWAARLPFTTAEIKNLQQAMEAEKPEFEHLGRMQWFDATMARIDEMLKRASDAPSAPAAKQAVKKAAAAAPEGTLSPLEVTPKGAVQMAEHQGRGGNISALKALQQARRQLGRGEDPLAIAGQLRDKANGLTIHEDDQSSPSQMDPDTLRERLRAGKKLLRQAATAVERLYERSRARSVEPSSTGRAVPAAPGRLVRRAKTDAENATFFKGKSDADLDLLMHGDMKMRRDAGITKEAVRKELVARRRAAKAAPAAPAKVTKAAAKKAAPAKAAPAKKVAKAAPVKKAAAKVAPAKKAAPVAKVAPAKKAVAKVVPPPVKKAVGRAAVKKAEPAQVEAVQKPKPNDWPEPAKLPVDEGRSKRVWEIRLPDGQLITRQAATIKQRPKYVSVVRTDNRELADFYGTIAYWWEQALKDYEKAIRTGDWSEFHTQKRGDTPGVTYVQHKVKGHNSDVPAFRSLDPKAVEVERQSIVDRGLGRTAVPAEPTGEGVDILDDIEAARLEHRRNQGSTGGERRMLDAEIAAAHEGEEAYLAFRRKHAVEQARMEGGARIRTIRATEKRYLDAPAVEWRVGQSGATEAGVLQRTRTDHGELVGVQEIRVFPVGTDLAPNFRAPVRPVAGKVTKAKYARKFNPDAPLPERTAAPVLTEALARNLAQTDELVRALNRGERPPGARAKLNPPEPLGEEFLEPELRPRKPKIRRGRGAARKAVAVEPSSTGRVVGAERTSLSNAYVRGYTAGMTSKELAQETGRSVGFVDRLLKEAGVQKRTGGARRPLSADQARRQGRERAAALRALHLAAGIEEAPAPAPAKKAVKRAAPAKAAPAVAAPPAKRAVRKAAPAKAVPEVAPAKPKVTRAPAVKKAEPTAGPAKLITDRDAELLQAAGSGKLRKRAGAPKWYIAEGGGSGRNVTSEQISRLRRTGLIQLREAEEGTPYDSYQITAKGHSALKAHLKKTPLQPKTVAKKAVAKKAVAKKAVAPVDPGRPLTLTEWDAVRFADRTDGKAFAPPRTLQKLQEDGFINADRSLTPKGKAAVTRQQNVVAAREARAKELVARLKAAESTTDGDKLLSSIKDREDLREIALQSGWSDWQRGDSADALRRGIVKHAVADRMRRDHAVEQQRPTITSLDERRTTAERDSVLATRDANGFQYRLVVGRDGRLESQARLSGKWRSTGSYPDGESAIRAVVGDGPQWKSIETQAPEADVDYEEATSASQLLDFARARVPDLKQIEGVDRHGMRHRDPKHFQKDYKALIDELADTKDTPEGLRAAAARVRRRAESVQGVSGMRIANNRPGTMQRGYGEAGEDAFYEMQNLAKAFERLADEKEGSPGTPLSTGRKVAAAPARQPIPLDDPALVDAYFRHYPRGRQVKETRLPRDLGYPDIIDSTGRVWTRRGRGDVYESGDDSQYYYNIPVDSKTGIRYAMPAQAAPAKKAVTKKAAPAKKVAAPAKKTAAPAKKTAAPAKKTAVKKAAAPVKKVAAKKAAPAAEATPTVTLTQAKVGDIIEYDGHRARVVEAAHRNPDNTVMMRMRLEIDGEPRSVEFVAGARGNKVPLLRRRPGRDADLDAVAKEVLAAQGIDDAILVLDQDYELTPAQLRKVAEKIGITDLGPQTRTAKALQLRIATHGRTPGVRGPAKVATPAKRVARAAKAEAPAAAAPTKPRVTRAKAVVPEEFDPEKVVAAVMGDRNKPPSQGEALKLLSDMKLTRPQMLAVAKHLSIPGAGRKNMDELRGEIYQATAGRRASSIAIRGFTEDRPDLVPLAPAAGRLTRSDMVMKEKDGTLPEVEPFYGSASPFSQHHAAPFTIDGITYPTAEHYMMAEKARLFGDNDALETILSAPTAAEAKRVGRTVKGFDEKRWADAAYDVVVRANLEKFRQNPELRKQLLDTGDKVLVEASPTDRIWGIGRTSANADNMRPSNWRGDNQLGFALMDVRDQLRREGGTPAKRTVRPKPTPPAPEPAAPKPSRKVAPRKPAVREIPGFDIDAIAQFERPEIKAILRDKAAQEGVDLPEDADFGEFITRMLRHVAADVRNDKSVAAKDWTAETKRRLGEMMDRWAEEIKAKEAAEKVAKRTVKKAVPAAKVPEPVDESVPLSRNPKGDNMYMHGDSATMRAAQAFAAAGRNGSANRLMELRRRATSTGADGLTPQQVVDELRKMRTEERQPKLQQVLNEAIDRVDAPMTPIPELPADTPESLVKLMRDLHAIPFARKSNGDRISAGTHHGRSLVGRLAEILRTAASGWSSDDDRDAGSRIYGLLREEPHEMEDASIAHLWQMAEPFHGISSPQAKELRAWERASMRRAMEEHPNPVTTPVGIEGEVTEFDPRLHMGSEDEPRLYPGDRVRVVNAGSITRQPGRRNSVTRAQVVKVKLGDSEPEIPKLTAQATPEPKPKPVIKRAGAKVTGMPVQELPPDITPEQLNPQRRADYDSLGPEEWRKERYLVEINSGTSHSGAMHRAKAAKEDDGRRPVLLSTLTGPQLVAVQGLTPGQQVIYFQLRNQGKTHDQAMVEARKAIGVTLHSGRS